MNSSQSYRQYREAQNEAASDYAMRVQEEQSSCYTDLQQLGANAEDELRRVYDNYLQGLRGAWAGDDAIQRASLAYRTLQREYARIQSEYFEACSLRQARTTDALNVLTSKASVKALDGWIEYLRELRQTLAQTGEPKPSDNKETA